MARIIQIIARLLAVLLVGKLGMDAEQAQPIALMAAELAGALGLAGVDWFIHTKFYISVEQHMAIVEATGGTDAAKGGNGDAGNSALTPNPQPLTPQTLKGLLLAFGLMTLLAGCSSAELVTTREGMDRGTATVRREYLAWAQDKAAKGEITADDLRIRQMTLNEYDALVAASRKAHPGTIAGTRRDTASTLPAVTTTTTGGTPVPLAQP